MSDTKEIIYNSPSMGRVTLLRTDEPVWFRGTTLEALESELSRRAAKDARVAVFYLYATDFDAIAAELEGRTKHVAPPVDPVADLREKLLWAGLKGATDDQLRAECERRGFDATTREMTKAWANDRAYYIGQAERLTKERDELKKALFQTQNAAIDPAKRDSCTVRGVTFVATARVGAFQETGRGIVGVKVERDTAHYVDPTDLLCEDV